MNVIISLVLGFGIPAAITAMYHSTLNLPPLWLWLISINIVLFGLMGKDKFAATHKNSARTPEITLLTLTFAGGTPALLIGRWLFRHKTKKQTFSSAMYGILVLQGLCIWYFWANLTKWM
jgi:uncharacterized membrane protein YsdA (DUF1294 family)